jgi:hypothetical protein
VGKPRISRLLKVIHAVIESRTIERPDLAFKVTQAELETTPARHLFSPLPGIDSHSARFM